MATWAQFEEDAPHLAADGRRLLHQRGDAEGFLATVGGERLPRINPVVVGIVAGRLYLFVVAGSAKHADFEADGRYALHAHLDAAVPVEFGIRGRARRVDDPAERGPVAEGWPFRVDDSYVLYELDVARVLLGERASRNEWPPRYSRWPGGHAASTR